MRTLAGAAFFLSCALWVALIATGAILYEGNDLPTAPSQLPFAWFDRAFRRHGALIPFVLLAVRAATSVGAAPAGGTARNDLREDIALPAAAYLLIALARTAVYHLHHAGYFLAARPYRTDTDLKHGVHVMSDHIFLAASVHAAVSAEVVLVTRAVEKLPRWGARWLISAATLAASLFFAFSVSLESYFTSRFFHPPAEILSAVLLGAALFQLPLYLWVQRRIWPSGPRHVRPHAGRKVSVAYS